MWKRYICPGWMLGANLDEIIDLQKWKEHRSGIFPRMLQQERAREGHMYACGLWPTAAVLHLVMLVLIRLDVLICEMRPGHQLRRGVVMIAQFSHLMILHCWLPPEPFRAVVGWTRKMAFHVGDCHRTSQTCHELFTRTVSTQQAHCGQLMGSVVHTSALTTAGQSVIQPTAPAATQPNMRGHWCCVNVLFHQIPSMWRSCLARLPSEVTGSRHVDKEAVFFFGLSRVLESPYQISVNSINFSSSVRLNTFSYPSYCVL